MLVHETKYGYVEELTSRKEVRDFVRYYREGWNNIVDGDETVYILYKNGKEVCVDEQLQEEHPEEIKLNNIEMMICNSTYGETYYNAFPQLEKDTDNEDNWMIRIGAEPDEYGEEYIFSEEESERSTFYA